MAMDQIVVVTAVGADQPGIVAGLAGALYDLGANLDDATMTRLHNAFATMVSASLPAGTTVDDCRAALRPLAVSLGLTVTVLPVAPSAPPSAPPDHLLTVYGADKPGIVYAVAARLAERGINITDMDTRRAGSDESPLYIMLIEIASGNIDLVDDIEALRKELVVDVTLKRLEREAL
jgi:glycine cleavage system transcriptional repressor